MITVINGDLIAANQLAEELGRRYFGGRFYHWHGAAPENIFIRFKHREEAVRGAYIRNVHEAENLEHILLTLNDEEAVKNESFGVIIATDLSIENTGANRLWCLTKLCSFQLITIQQF